MTTPELITHAIYTLNMLKERNAVYDALNVQTRAVQGDFYTHVQAFDTIAITTLVGMLDHVLCGQASYYLWENGTTVTHEDGTEYEVKTVEQIEAYARQFSPYGEGQE